ncbi:MAG: SUMF1/EgtB/PvdO family nonheme iron enzyme [Ottowia sp.]|nr:SUMF1/EgtB/PvdO family nonheme iron enzyme [Ottowia sp.]
MQKRHVLSALCAALALCATSALAAMPDGEFAKLCFPGTAAQVKQALKDGANPNARDERDPVSADPALHSAARSDTEAADKVRALLAAGADVNARERRYGKTALMGVSSPEVAAVLLAAGADVNAIDEGFGETALFAAARNGHTQMIEVLLRAGAAVNAQGKNSQTPLMVAASSGQVEAVRALLAAGADAKLKDGNDWDALQHARSPDEDADREGTAACVKLLQDAANKPAAKPEKAGTSAAAAPEKTYKNSIGMEFVLIAAGSFQMGCASGAGKQRPEVTIPQPFYLGKYEVTQAQWEAVMGGNPSTHKGANHPVDSVSWNDAQEFIKKLNAKEGHSRYRLPTEAEWEYADRAGAADYCRGENNKHTSTAHAWYGEAMDSGSHPVGGKQPNAWGLHDMHGNVDEWTQGSYLDSGAPEGALRVLRGGNWFNDAGFAGATYRAGAEPGNRSELTGLRLALTPEQ